jgi:hypothetical protein
MMMKYRQVLSTALTTLESRVCEYERGIQVRRGPGHQGHGTPGLAEQATVREGYRGGMGVVL